MSGDSKEEAKWISIQKKTFTKWMNGHLKKKSHPMMTDPVVELETGTNLMNLINSLYDIPVPKHNRTPKMRPHKLDNCELALKMLHKDAQVKTNFLGTMHLVDHDLKMILGMVWAIILDYQIKGISVDDLSAKEGLLLWVQQKTKGYNGVNVKNFTDSFVDGLAFCALIHRFRPDLLDYDSLNPHDHDKNLSLAFDIAEKDLQIPRLLDVEDMKNPDEKSVMTYVSEFFHKFASQDQKEVAARRIQKFVLFTQNIHRREGEYEQGAQNLVTWIEHHVARLNDHSFSDGETAEAARKLFEDFKQFSSNEKTEKSKLKLDLESDFAEIQTTLQKNNRHLFAPPDALNPDSLDHHWNRLAEAERLYGAALRAHVFKFITKKVDEASPEQMKEFEDTFRHFDKNNDNFLDRLEFKACLSALGIPFRDESAYEQVFFLVSNGGDGITLDQFVKYMKDLTTDRDTPEQIKNSFKILADEKPAISGHELKVHPLEESDIHFLSQSMAPFANGAQFDYSAFTDSVFTHHE